MLHDFDAGDWNPSCQNVLTFYYAKYLFIISRYLTSYFVYCSSQQQSLALTSDLSVLELTRKELENKMGSLKEQHQRDAASLKTLLNEAEKQAKDAQKEVSISQVYCTYKSSFRPKLKT